MGTAGGTVRKVAGRRERGVWKAPLGLGLGIGRGLDSAASEDDGLCLPPES